jgi:hypothetical protein
MNIEAFDKDAMEALMKRFFQEKDAEGNKKVTSMKEYLESLDLRTRNIIMFYYEIGFIAGRDHEKNKNL